MIILNQFSLDPDIMSSFIGLTISFLLNVVMIFLIISYIYITHNVNRGILFSLYLFNIVVFALTVSFQNNTLSMGSGFGMFVVFAMMRYRSEVVSLKDMTYLLIVITLGILHGTLYANGGIANILFMDLAILVTVYLLEKKILCKNQCYKKIKYNKMEMIRPENREKLREEIIQKTGLNVLDIKIEGMNLAENCVTLCVYYAEESTMKVIKSSDDESVEEVQDGINGDRKPWNRNKGAELLKRFGTYSLKMHNSWLLMIILVTLILIFGVTMDGFAILA